MNDDYTVVGCRSSEAVTWTGPGTLVLQQPPGPRNYLESRRDGVRAAAPSDRGLTAIAVVVALSATAKGVT
jgi:hypothetical protein